MELTFQSVYTVILLCIFTFLLAQIYNLVFRGFAPFRSTKKKIVEKIISELDIKKDAVVYDLGCGDANFLRKVGEKYPEAMLMGVENSFLPYILAGIQDLFLEKKIEIMKKDLFKVNLSEVDMIYCYLNKRMMVKLGKKIEKECEPGTLIISHKFPLKNKESFKTIKEGKDRVYFYKV